MYPNPQRRNDTFNTEERNTPTPQNRSNQDQFRGNFGPRGAYNNTYNNNRNMNQPRNDRFNNNYDRSSYSNRPNNYNNPRNSFSGRTFTPSNSFTPRRESNTYYNNSPQNNNDRSPRGRVINGYYQNFESNRYGDSRYNPYFNRQSSYRDNRNDNFGNDSRRNSTSSTRAAPTEQQPENNPAPSVPRETNAHLNSQDARC